MLQLWRAALSSFPCSAAAVALASRQRLCSAPAATPACQNLSTASEIVTSPTAAASDFPAVADSSNSSASTPPPADTALVRAEEQQHRRGFGGKVSLPAEDVLKQVVVAGVAEGGSVELTLRSYHVGESLRPCPVLFLQGQWQLYYCCRRDHLRACNHSSSSSSSTLRYICVLAWALSVLQGPASTSGRCWHVCGLSTQSAAPRPAKTMHSSGCTTWSHRQQQARRCRRCFPPSAAATCWPGCGGQASEESWTCRPP